MTDTTLICLIVAVVLVIWFILTFNRFVQLKTSLEEAFSTMDVYLKKRWDLIPNVIESIKGYAKHEQETFAKMVDLRNKSYQNMSINDKIELNKEISSGLTKLFAIAENYPDLKASQNFLDLNTQLATVEEDIANARKYYNAVAKDYNVAVQTIPSNIVALLCNMKKTQMFEIDEAQRENVKVKF